MELAPPLSESVPHYEHQQPWIKAGFGGLGWPDRLACPFCELAFQPMQSSLVLLLDLTPILVTTIADSLRHPHGSECATSDHNREWLVLYPSSIHQQDMKNLGPLPSWETNEKFFIEKE